MVRALGPSKHSGIFGGQRRSLSCVHAHRRRAGGALWNDSFGRRQLQRRALLRARLRHCVQADTPQSWPDCLKRANPVELFGGSDGSSPFAGVIADRMGALYGTNVERRADNHCVFRERLGRCFQADASQRRRDRLERASALGLFGRQRRRLPKCGAHRRQNGLAYGTTSTGGNNNSVCNFGSNGVVLKLMPPGPTAWTETMFWAFSGGSDGCFPVAPLIADERGQLMEHHSLAGRLPPLIAP
jgi:hypothetical protein